jgi:LysR family transcriptional regulator, glycine cleavage system transcriptional activator
MRRATPSTQSLIAFTATARHLSFTKAALEMNLTQGAVSRQMAALEAFVRAPLFERLNPGLALTPAGAAYLPKVEAALRDLETATLELQAFGGRPNHVNVACPPSFASIWLMPRLAHFRQNFPNLTLNLFPPVWAEPMPSNIDLAVRYGEGTWPNMDSHYLFGRENVIVAAAPPRTHAKAARRSTTVSLPRKDSARQLTRRLQQGPLLHHAQVPNAWPEALAALGIERDVNGYAGPRFAQYTMLLNAAAAGFGVALIPTALAQRELHEGRVALVSPQSVQLSGGYFACFPREQRSTTVVDEITQWMRTEAAAN